MFKKLLLICSSVITGLTATGFATSSEYITPFYTPETISIASKTINSTQFDNLVWEYSLFGKMGSNISELNSEVCYSNGDWSSANNIIARTYDYNGSVSKTQTIPVVSGSDFKCIPLNADLSKDSFNYLFDRRLPTYSQNSPKGVFAIDRVQGSYSMSFKYNLFLKSAFEFRISSFITSFSTFGEKFKTVYKLYNKDNILTTIVDGGTYTFGSGLLQWDLPNRINDVWSLDIEFSTIHDDSDTYSMQLGEISAFSNNTIFKPGFEGNGSGDLLLPLPEYSDCSWNNLFCHLSNFGTWLVRDFPPTQVLYTGFNYVLTMFSSLFTMFVGLFGITISTGNIISSQYIGILGYVMLLGFSIGMWKLISFVRGLLS